MEKVFLFFFGRNRHVGHSFLSRLLLTGVFLLLVVPLALAQEQRIYIDNFVHDPMDQTAKEHPKTDANGNLYALVKVRPGAKDFKFEFGYIKCINDGEHDGETWLYVGKSARKVTIRREGYEPLRAVDLGMTLEAGGTYVMQLSYTAPKVQKQMLQFSVKPEGAQAVVMIKAADADNYELFGTTGARSDVAKNLPLGTYAYQVMAENYSMAEGIVVLDNEQETKTEQVALTPNFSATTLKVDADAEIYVDNQLKGTRLWSGALEAGEYNVETRQANHRPSAQRITVKRGEARTFTLAPPVPITGKMSVISEPSGATIQIDGKNYGKTPRNVSDVLIGKRTLTVTLPDYKEETMTVNVEEGRTTDVDVSLSRLSAVAINSRRSKQYLKPSQFYVSPTFQAGTFMGAGIALGGYVSNVNVEISFLYGVGGDDTLYKNNDQTKTSTQLEGSFTKYFAGGKVGYGLSLGSNVRLTPQVGAGILGFSHKDKTLPKSSAIVATVGARLDYAFSSHVGLFIAPEGSFAVSQSEGFKAVADVSSKVKGWATGFNCRVGVSFFF